MSMDKTSLLPISVPVSQGWKVIARNALFLVAGIVSAAGFAETVLSIAPVDNGLRVDIQNMERPIHLQPYYKYQRSSGWNFRSRQAGVFNDYGYIASSNFAGARDGILVIGNSYVQAADVAADANLHAILGGISKSRPVLGLGKDGASLGEYLAIAQWGIREFSPHTIVFVLIEGDVTRSTVPYPGLHHFQLGENGAMALVRSAYAKPAAWKYEAMRSSLAAYIVNNLKYKIHLQNLRIPSQSNSSAQDNDSKPPVGVDNISSAFISQLESVGGGHGIDLVILIDADRLAIYRHQIGSEDRDIDSFARHPSVRKLARVIALDSSFRKSFEQNGVKLDDSPFNYHWNAQGHAIAAREAAETLFAKQIQP